MTPLTLCAAIRRANRFVSQCLGNGVAAQPLRPPAAQTPIATSPLRYSAQWHEAVTRLAPIAAISLPAISTASPGVRLSDAPLPKVRPTALSTNKTYQDYSYPRQRTPACACSGAGSSRSPARVVLLGRTAHLGPIRIPYRKFREDLANLNRRGAVPRHPQGSSLTLSLSARIMVGFPRAWE